MCIKKRLYQIFFILSCATLFLLASNRVSEAKTGAGYVQKNIVEIRTVVFINQAAMGYGGMIIAQPTPVVLFKNGEACKSVQAVVYNKGLAAHKRKYPTLWTRWKVKNGKLMLKDKKGWRKVPYKGKYGPLKRGAKLHNAYSRTSGVGNTAMGGRSKVTSVETFVFSKNGRFSHEGVAAGSANSNRSRAEGYGKSKRIKGKYTIDGYLLTLRLADGRRSANFIVADPKNSRAIWINGRGYVAK